MHRGCVCACVFASFLYLGMVETILQSIRFKRNREPPAIKQLRTKIQNERQQKERHRVSKLLLAARRHWLSTLKAIRSSKLYESGKSAWKAKKLLPLSQMLDKNGYETCDHAKWAELVEDYFRDLWKCNHPSKRSIINDWLTAHAGCGLRLGCKDIEDALARLRKPHVLDHYGCCAKGLSIVAQVRPAAVAAALTKLARNQKELESIVIQGSVRAKKCGAIPASKVRTILPMPVVLGVVDAIVAAKMHEHIDTFAARVPHSYLECARKHRQVMDAVFPISLVVEKGLDDMSQGCIGQQDIKQYYDHLSALKVAQWLIGNCSCGDLAASFLRIHCCPQLILKVASGAATFAKRSIGVYTGSRSAAAAGRIPLLDIARKRADSWAEKAYSQNGCQCALASFVDNLLTAGPTPEAVISVLEDCSNELAAGWQLSIGADSKEIMPCKEYRPLGQIPPEWQQQETFRTLGHRIDNDGGIASCFDETIGAMQRAFFGNLSRGVKHASAAAKFRFMRSSVQSIAQFRWARWPYQKSYAKRLDATQRKMLGILFDVKPNESEPYDAFVQRRHCETGRIASKCGRWSVAWAQGVIGWNDHMRRGHDPGAWSPKLLDWHDTTWLALRRLLNSSGAESRTRTRAYRGPVHKRWQESLEDAYAIAV